MASALEGDRLSVGGLTILVSWFLTQHGRWSASTLRTHRAGLLHLCRSVQANWTPKGRRINNLTARLRRERPTPARDVSRTSARKRKSVTRREVLMVRSKVAGTDRLASLLRSLSDHLSRIDVRPCELLSARLVGRRLIVRGAKTTNGRGLRVRPLVLKGYTPKEVRDLRRMLTNFRELVANPEIGDWKRLLKLLSERLARACQRAKVRRISFYTLRHVAIATTKRFESRLGVAAFAGHCRTRTAAAHYGKRRSGWLRPTGVVPDPCTFACIIDNYRPYDAGRPAHARELARADPPRTPSPTRIVSAPSEASNADLTMSNRGTAEVSVSVYDQPAALTF